MNVWGFDCPEEDRQLRFKVPSLDVRWGFHDVHGGRQEHVGPRVLQEDIHTPCHKLALPIPQKAVERAHYCLIHPRRKQGLKCQLCKRAVVLTEHHRGEQICIANGRERVSCCAEDKLSSVIAHRVRVQAPFEHFERAVRS